MKVLFYQSLVVGRALAGTCPLLPSASPYHLRFKVVPVEADSQSPSVLSLLSPDPFPLENLEPRGSSASCLSSSGGSRSVFLVKKERDMIRFRFLVAILNKQNSQGCSLGNRKSQLCPLWPCSPVHLTC